MLTATLGPTNDDRLHIWHMFYGKSGHNNDTNVFEVLKLRNKIANGDYSLLCNTS